MGQASLLPTFPAPLDTLNLHPESSPGSTMQMPTRCLLTVGLAFTLATVVLAQVVKFRPPADFAQIHLLRNDSVQKELKLTPTQVEKLREAFTQNQESTREVWQKVPPEEV